MEGKEERRWRFPCAPVSSLVLLSFFIFLSGVAIEVSVLGLGVWGFSLLSSTPARRLEGAGSAAGASGTTNL